MFTAVPLPKSLVTTKVHKMLQLSPLRSEPFHRSDGSTYHLRRESYLPTSSHHIPTLSTSTTPKRNASINLLHPSRYNQTTYPRQDVGV